MNKIIEGVGHCVCGKTGIVANKVNNSVHACHCNTCRKWGGGPAMSVDCGTDVTLEGEENISIFDSSDWAERGFCKQCGSHLFYRMKENKQYIVPVGIFKQEDQMVLQHQIFIDEKPSYYDFSNNTENMTGAEVFEKFSLSSES